MVSMPGMPNNVSNNGGVITGTYSPASGTQAYRWTAATGVVGLGDLPGGSFYSEGLAISADGSVIAGRGSTAAGVQSFRWTASEGMVGLGVVPGQDYSIPRGVSDDGQTIVGGHTNFSNQAFRWTQATGFQGLGDLEGGYFRSEARDVSDDGSVVVGMGSVDPGVDQAFRWTAGTGMIGLGYLPGENSSQAFAVTADGNTIVGESDFAFIWDPVHGMRNLAQALAADYGLVIPPGWVLDEATGISADGSVIVGTGRNPQTNTEAWRIVIPEPASAFLFAICTVAICIRRRSRISRS
jgi:probable HAF family extracellular repeat protein